MKELVLFENILKDSVETFLIMFETVTTKGNQEGLLIDGAGENLTVVALTGPYENAFYLSKCNSTPCSTVIHKTLGIKRNKNQKNRGKTFHALLARNQCISCCNLVVTNKRMELDYGERIKD